jgi:hypothetical protein
VVSSDCHLADFAVVVGVGVMSHCLHVIRQSSPSLPTKYQIFQTLPLSALPAVAVIRPSSPSPVNRPPTPATDRPPVPLSAPPADAVIRPSSLLPVNSPSAPRRPPCRRATRRPVLSSVRHCRHLLTGHPRRPPATTSRPPATTSRPSSQFVRYSRRYRRPPRWSVAPKTPNKIRAYQINYAHVGNTFSRTSQFYFILLL